MYSPPHFSPDLVVQTTIEPPCLSTFEWNMVGSQLQMFRLRAEGSEDSARRADSPILVGIVNQGKRPLLEVRVLQQWSQKRHCCVVGFHCERISISMLKQSWR